MKTTHLFPYRFKWISGVVFTIALLCYATLYVTDSFDRFQINTKVFALISDQEFFNHTGWFGMIENGITDEILFTLIIVSGLVFAFSKEKTEDEMVASLRLNSLVRATVANYVILLLCYLLVYGFSFLNVLNVAMFSQLLIFIALFRISMYRFNTSAGHEE